MSDHLENAKLVGQIKEGLPNDPDDQREATTSHRVHHIHKLEK